MASRIIRVQRPDQFMLTPGGREGDPSPRITSEKQNWVDEQGGMPIYMRMVRNALMRDGHDTATATAIAVNAMKRWAAGANGVHPQVRAAAGEALAQWEKMKASSHAETAAKEATHK